jgi:hypothetical protein
MREVFAPEELIRLRQKTLQKLKSGLRQPSRLRSKIALKNASQRLRRVGATNDAVAIAISTGNTVDYCLMSNAMKTLPQLNWIKKGTAVPAGTETHRFNADPGRVASGARATNEIDVRDWLGGARSVAVTEEVVGLGRYGKTLTVLSSASIGDETVGYDDDDDEAILQESWTPKFHK